MSKKLQNSVVTRGEYIEVVLAGPQPYDTLKNSADEVVAASREFIDRDDWVLLLINLTDQGAINARGLQYIKEAYNFVSYDRLAIYGANPVMYQFLKLLIATTRRQSSSHLAKAGIFYRYVKDGLL